MSFFCALSLLSPLPSYARSAPYTHTHTHHERMHARTHAQTHTYARARAHTHTVIMCRSPPVKLREMEKC